MLNFNDAFEIAISSARRLSSERVSIDCAMNRVLAETVASDIDMPPFNKSAMDGFACRRVDLSDDLTVIETIAAGYMPQQTVGPGQCAKIMTGAVVPERADCVIMVEYTESAGENKIRFTGGEMADNICFKGEDIKAGDVILDEGTCLGAEHIAVLASVGCVKPLVSRQPKVGVIATGNELVEPTEKPSRCQIRNSNSYQLAAQITGSGAIALYYGIAGDSEDAIESILKKAIPEVDVIIFSGGVSAGDFDFVPKILKQNNIKLMFEKIAIKPGKPTVFGVADNFYCFGLPGNPVSTFILFELLVKPFLYKLTGCDYKAVSLNAVLAKAISRKKPSRDSWMPVTLGPDGKVTVVEYHGSAHINALCQADGIICVPAGIEEIKEGSNVTVRVIGG